MRPPKQQVSETETKGVGGSPSIKREHPAFGRIVLSRPHGGIGRLFGSDLNHNGCVSIEIEAVYETRDLSREWIHGDRLLLRLEMSEAQWAHFVSSSGRGEGTPVTLRDVRDGDLVRIPEIAEPTLSRRERHSEEMRTQLSAALASLHKAVVTLERMGDAAGPIPKKEFRELARSARFAVENLPANTAFIHDQFNEAMEGIVEASKTEVEAYITNAIHRAGMEAIAAKGLPQLTTNKKEGS